MPLDDIRYLHETIFPQDYITPQFLFPQYSDPKTYLAAFGQLQEPSSEVLEGNEALSTLTSQIPPLPLKKVSSVEDGVNLISRDLLTGIGSCVWN
jgi:hypothetical protein